MPWRSRDLNVMQQVIYRCAALHLDHIARGGDPFEFGTSRPLDFGHWAAHKLEQLSGFELGHGEAVALGLALDSTYAYLIGPPPERRLAADPDHPLATWALPSMIPELEDRSGHPGRPGRVPDHLGGRLTIMLLWDIGQGLEVHEIEPGPGAG